MKPTIIAIIPAFNEGATIKQVVVSVAKELDKVVVIDDGSADNTRNEAESGGAYLITHAFNKGYDQSLNDGFMKAMELNGDVFVTLDADGQHNATDIKKLIGPIVDGTYDVVVSSRNNIKSGSELLFAFFTNLRFGIDDPLCGLKAYSRKVYEKVGFFDSKRSIGTELMIRALLLGFRVKVVPITVASRLDQSRFYRRKFTAHLKIFWAFVGMVILSFFRF